MKKILLLIIFISQYSYSYFTDGLYNWTLVSNKVNVRFTVSDNSTKIESITLIFKNYLPQNDCNLNIPLNGPFSVGLGNISNNACLIQLKGSGPRFNFYFESWCTSDIKLFNYKLLLSIDGCIINTLSGTVPANDDNTNTGGLGDDDDDSTPTGTKNLSEGDNRIDSGANTPLSEIIGIDVEINPSIITNSPFSYEKISNVELSFILSNEKINVPIDINKLKVIGLNKTNLILNSEWENIIPNKKFKNNLNGLTNNLNGTYLITFIYDDKFTSYESITIQNLPIGKNQAFIVPPPERKLFHRGIISK